ncbi:sensor histidine kinase [Nocardioides sp. J54]|uniref:sensor histidine kinase n=1 Tax=Nocardioides sp. J54 TaxID=935866 RepID=UPI00048F2BCE|nr:ATP-binding protein [Nocardioides sp. J54]
MTGARGWRVLAWLLGALGWGTVVAALGTSLVAGRIPDEVANWAMDLVVATLYSVVVVVLLPRTRRLAVWIIALTGVGCGVAGLATSWVTLEAGTPGQGAALYLQYWTWTPGLYAVVAVLPFIVVGPVPRWRTAAAAAGAVLAVAGTLPGMTVVAPGLPHNPLGIDHAGWQEWIRDSTLWLDRSVTAMGAFAAVWLFVHARSLRARQRQGVLWLATGQVLLVVAMVVFLLPWPDNQARLAAEVSGVTLLLAQVFLPAALLVLVLGQRLWGIEATVDRATVWTSLTAAAVAAYLVLVSGLARVLPDGSGLAQGLAVPVLAVSFLPAQRAVQRRVDTLVYGTGSRPDELWSAIDVSSEHDLDELADRLRRGLRVGAVRILPVGPDGTLPAAPGGRSSDVVRTLSSRGREVGLLVVTPRTGERLDRRTSALLDQVAGLLATVLDLARANEALVAARSRLVGIRNEERRVLRRDLHDGLGPAIAGIRLGLTAARNLRERDPEAADRMLDQLGEELQLRSEEVRRMSRGLLPPALDEGDLAAALRALADRFAGADLIVQVDVSPQVQPGPVAQTALYHVASEALLNVHRHAMATRCEVVVRPGEDGGVVLVVTDDGVGLDEQAAQGIGLRSMRERAEELGGSVATTSPGARGTRVVVHLPPLGGAAPA